jgi:hypothetical protein
MCGVCRVGYCVGGGEGEMSYRVRFGCVRKPSFWVQGHVRVDLGSCWGEGMFQCVT